MYLYIYKIISRSNVILNNNIFACPTLYIRESNTFYYKMPPIYLLECHTWSDGESDHKEDHNIYYDLKYFYIVKKPNYICTYCWNAYSGDHNTGMITETISRQHLEEHNAEKMVGDISDELAKFLVEKDFLVIQKRCQDLKCWASRDDYCNTKYINEQNLCNVVEIALQTWTR